MISGYLRELPDGPDGPYSLAGLIAANQGEAGSCNGAAVDVQSLKLLALLGPGLKVLVHFYATVVLHISRKLLTERHGPKPPRFKLQRTGVP